MNFPSVSASLRLCVQSERRPSRRPRTPRRERRTGWDAKAQRRGGAEKTGTARRPPCILSPGYLATWLLVAHLRIADTDHVADALLEEFFGDREHAPLGHAGCAQGAGGLQDDDAVGGDVQGLVVDAGLQVGVVLEDEGGAGVLEQPRLGGGGVDHAAVGGEGATGEEGGAGFGGGVFQREGHLVIAGLGAGAFL